MTIYSCLISALWLTLVACWALSARARKRNFGGRWTWWREIAVRLGLFALVVLVLQVAVVGQALPNAQPYALDTSLLRGVLGSALCLLGIGLALLARRYLDPQWVTPGSDTKNAELITAGPYALVRHPLYGGLLLALLGSVIGQSVFWLLPLTVYAPFFIASARREEQHLLGQFPDRYRAYMQRTKMLWPFVL